MSVTLPGFGYANAARQYEDLTSLKQFIRGRSNLYNTNTMIEVMLHGNYLTTGTAHKVLSDGVTLHAVSNIGKTEVTIVLSASGDNAETTGLIYTFVYQSNDGVSHTSLATGTAALNGTPVAFVPAITDFYCATSFTGSAATAVVSVVAKVAAGATYATISTGATASTAIQLFGIGAVYGRSHTDHGDGDSKVQYLDYFTPWGEIVKGATCTHTTTASDEIRFIKSDAATYVSDFHRVISHRASVATTANCHEFFISDADIGNLDGSGGDIYSCIDELAQSAFNVSYYTPEGWVGWLAQLRISCQNLPTNLEGFVVNIYLKANGETLTKNFVHYVKAQNVWELDCPIPLEAETDTYIEIVDLVTATLISVDAIFVGVKEAT